MDDDVGKRKLFTKVCSSGNTGARVLPRIYREPARDPRPCPCTARSRAHSLCPAPDCLVARRSLWLLIPVKPDGSRGGQRLDFGRGE